MFTEKRRTISAAVYIMLTLVLMTGMLFGGVQQTFGQMQENNGCMEDVAGSGLNCTANDISIATRDQHRNPR